MDSKINVLGIYIDNYTGKEAMKEAVGYMESDPVNIVELLTVDAVMDVDLQQETKEQLRSFDLVLAGDKTILEAADVEEKRCLQETENHLFMKMFLRYLHKNHKRVYLLVETQEEGEAFFQYLEHYYRGIQIVGMAKVSAENRADDECDQWCRDRLCTFYVMFAASGRFCGKEQSTSQYENSFRYGKSSSAVERDQLWKGKSHPILYPENFQKRDGKAKGRERQECRGRHLKDIQIQKEKSEEINKKL